MNSRLLILSAMLVSLIWSGCDHRTKSIKPNFIIIQADDLGIDDLPIYGNKIVKTPHIDKLAEQSVVFTNFIVNPVCAASRASLLTGKDHLLTGVSHVHGGLDFLHLEEQTIGDIFRSAGYVTGMWGKWHSGNADGYYPWQRGFDEAYMAKLYVHQNPIGLFNGEYVESEGWSDEVVVDYAIDFMEKNRDHSFLAYLSFLTCHEPLVAKEELIQKYMSLGLSRHLSAIYAMIENMDAEIGRLIEVLKQMGLYDNTVLVFLSDNGPAILNGLLTENDRVIRYHNGYKGHKGNIWNNGVKSPMLLHYPQKLASRTSSLLCDITDLLPTFLEVAEIDTSIIPRGITGTSFWKELVNAEDFRPKKKVFNYANRGWPPTDEPWTPVGIEGEYEPVVNKQTDSLLHFNQQIVSVQVDGYKLLKNASSRENKVLNEDGYVLIDWRNDEKEDSNIILQNQAIFDSLREELAQWYSSIVDSKHSFEPTVFLIGEDRDNEVLLFAPSFVSNDLKIAFNYSYPWNNPEMLATFDINVLDEMMVQPVIKQHGLKNMNGFFIEIDGEISQSIGLSEGGLLFEPIWVRPGFSKIRLGTDLNYYNSSEVQMFQLYLGRMSSINDVSLQDVKGSNESL